MSASDTKIDDAIFARLRDTSGVTAALKRAAREAIERHARLRQEIVIWRDGQIVREVPQIPGEDDTAEPRT